MSIWQDSPDETAFRAGLRTWLGANTPEGPLPAGAEERAVALHDWHRRLAAAGFVGLSLPTRFGGRGLDARSDAICNEELGLAGAPPAPPIGHLAHALALFGSDELIRGVNPWRRAIGASVLAVCARRAIAA